MSDKIYKLYQKLYNDMVSDHTDDFSLMTFVEDSEIVNNALSYFKEATFPLIYPSKSYSVAIIYATLIEQVYGYPILETLNDPDLFLGQDEFFVPYSEDPTNYDAIIERLKSIDNWIEKGWSPQTVKYFYMECTEEGISNINNSSFE